METVAGEQSAAESDRDSGALFVLPSAGTPAQQSFTHNVGSTVGSVRTPDLGFTSCGLCDRVDSAIAVS